MPASPRLLLVDDHALFREGVESILSARRPDTELCCADSVAAAENVLIVGQFDLILIDIDLGNDNGLDTLLRWQTRWPNLPAVVLSASLQPEYMLRALDIGARGFIPKTCSGAVMVGAIDLILAGGTYVPPELLSRSGLRLIAETPPREPDSDQAAGSSAVQLLTPRQLEVLSMLAHGFSNKEVARRLDMADGTVRTHVNALFRVLQVSNRTQAVIRAQQLGCVPTSDGVELDGADASAR